MAAGQAHDWPIAQTGRKILKEKKSKVLAKSCESEGGRALCVFLGGDYARLREAEPVQHAGV